MVDIEPYQYQKVTNIKEHNDIVAKINEIVDVINNTNLDTIVPRIDKIETDITGINSTDALQWQDIESVKGDIDTITPKITKLEQDVTDINSTDAVQNTDITNLKAKDSEHDSRLGTVDTEIAGITKSLVSDVAILNGTTSGNVKVRIERENAPSIDSNDYNLQKPTSVELIQGSAPAMVKAQITLSDGTVLISDDFMFTTAPIGEDVYISSFVFKNGNVAGSISADIGLSNGSTLTANNFVVPTDPNVTTAISDLQGRVTTVENDVSGLKTIVNGHTTSINNLNNEVSDLQTRVTAVESDTSGLDALKATVDGHTASISALDSDVADLQINKADVNDSNQSIVAGSISATNITKGGVAVATVNDIPTISGGETWEEVDLNNWPTNWVAGDRVKLSLYNCTINFLNTPPNTWEERFTLGSYTMATTVIPVLTEIEIPTVQSTCDIVITSRMSTAYSIQIGIRNVYGPTNWNSGKAFEYSVIVFNGTKGSRTSGDTTTATLSKIVYKMWRLKK